MAGVTVPIPRGETVAGGGGGGGETEELETIECEPGNAEAAEADNFEAAGCDPVRLAPVPGTTEGCALPWVSSSNFGPTPLEGAKRPTAPGQSREDCWRL